MKFKYVIVTLLVPCSLLGMEPQDLEAAKPPLPSNEVIRAIRAGQVSKLKMFLAQPIKPAEPTRAATDLLVESTAAAPQPITELKKALGFMPAELATEQQKLVTQVGQKIWTRYQYVLIPAGITTASLAALIASAIALKNQPIDPVTQAVLDPLAKNTLIYSIVQSALAAAGAGYKTGLQLRKAWTDHRQQKIVDALQNSQALLEALEKLEAKSTNPAAAGVITTAIANTQMDIAHLQVAAAQATVAAQDAAADAAALDTDTGKSEQSAAPVTRSLITRGHSQQPPAHGSPTIAHQFAATASPLIADGAAAQSADSTTIVAQPATTAVTSAISLQDVIADENAAARTSSPAPTLQEELAQDTTAQVATQEDTLVLVDTRQAVTHLKQVAAQETARLESETQELQAKAQAETTAPTAQPTQDAPPFGLMPATKAWLESQQQTQEDEAQDATSTAQVLRAAQELAQEEERQVLAAQTAVAPQQPNEPAQANKRLLTRELLGQLFPEQQIAAPEYTESAVQELETVGKELKAALKRDDTAVAQETAASSLDTAPDGTAIDWRVMKACMADAELSLAQREQEAARAQEVPAQLTQEVASVVAATDAQADGASNDNASAPKKDE